MEYLAKKKKPAVFHYWYGSNTACRLWSTGIMSKSYKLIHSTEGLRLCKICKHKHQYKQSRRIVGECMTKHTMEALKESALNDECPDLETAFDKGWLCCVEYLATNGMIDWGKADIKDIPQNDLEIALCDLQEMGMYGDMPKRYLPAISTAIRCLKVIGGQND